MDCFTGSNLLGRLYDIENWDHCFMRGANLVNILFFKPELFARGFNVGLDSGRDALPDLFGLVCMYVYDILYVSHDLSLPVTRHCLVKHYAILILIFGFYFSSF